MKIAVTGATGGLGRSLSEFLRSQGMQVVALGRNQKAGNELKALGAEFLAGDITDTNYLKQGFANCEAVVHCAGFASPFGDWETFYNSNVVGTKAVLDAMAANNIFRLVHISTPSVYFSGRPRQNVREDSPLPKQVSFYGRSKLMADELVFKETAERKLNSVLIRPRAIIGKYDTTILPRILRVLEKGFFPLPDGGRSLVDITAVENVNHAIWLALKSEKVFRAEIFNITNGEPLSVKELTARLAKALNKDVRFIPIPMPVLKIAALASETFAKNVTKKEPTFSRYGIESLGTTQTLSIDKAKSLLGYAPVITVEQALENYVKLRALEKS